MVGEFRSALVLVFSAAAFAVTLSRGAEGEGQAVSSSSLTADPGALVVYPVGDFRIEYGPPGSTPHPDLPSISELRNLRVNLAKRGDTFVSPTLVDRLFPIELNNLPQAGRFSADALIAINKALADELNRHGIYAAWAMPDARDIDPQTGRDLREGRPELRLLVYAAQVERIRTIARGTRVPSERSTNSPVYRRVVENSPLQPRGTTAHGSLLHKPRLDDYVNRLNRFPGRTVAASLGAADRPGTLGLDYLISEGRPWLAYAQVANTGTEASGDWRERFGFVHQQLTGHDDILSLDYVTADFEHSHAFFGSYEMPLIYPDRLKAKVLGSYGEFTADELGLSLLNVSGSLWLAGGDLTFSPLSFAGTSPGRFWIGPTFLDFTVGGKWMGIEMNNRAFGVEAGSDLFLPYVGVSLSSISQQVRITAGIQLEGNLAEVAGTRQSEVENLGRPDVNREWLAVKWGTGFSTFVEPFFDPQTKHFNHELAVFSRGQYVFDDRRVIPQQAELIGGAYSVRGYPEAFDLGDTVYVGTAEYRFYLGRALRPPLDEKLVVGAKGTERSQFDNPFRFRARDAYSRPDWDLFLRAFVDGGQTFNNRRRSTETDRNLLSTGVGMEFQLRRNLNVRLDYGIALRSEKENLRDPVDSGDSRVHFSAMVAW